MKATVKRPYYDDLGLHKVGEVVEVEQASDLVEIIAEEIKTEIESEKEEKKEEKKKPAPRAKATKKKG